MWLKDKLLNIGNKQHNSLRTVPWFKDAFTKMVKIAQLNNPLTDPIHEINDVFNTVVVALRNIIKLIIHTLSFSSGVFADSIKPRIDGITNFQNILRECQRIYDHDLSIDDFDLRETDVSE